MSNVKERMAALLAEAEEAGPIGPVLETALKAVIDADLAVSRLVFDSHSKIGSKTGPSKVTQADKEIGEIRRQLEKWVATYKKVLEARQAAATASVIDRG